MSGSAFGPAYAETYDWFYSDKDYARECDLLAELFRRCSGREVLSILDLGCGTGGHAFLQDDLQTLDLGRRFDAAPMMFAVLGYQTSDAEVSAALAAARRHLCRVRYRLRQEEAGGQPQESAEEHIVRYFFPMEIEQFLTGCRFELVHLSDFTDLGAEPTLETWNVLACAKAI